jgi:hypothetical protein
MGRGIAPHPSDCVGLRDGDVDVLEEERGERSELEAYPCVCLGVLDVLGQRPYERGGMPDPFGAMPDANREALSVARTAPRRVGSHARIERRDALRKGRHPPPVPRDAPPVTWDARPAPPDAPPIPGDAPRIRSDPVRMRRLHSRRVMWSSPTSWSARSIPRERERARRKLLGAQDDVSRIRRLRRRTRREMLRMSKQNRSTAADPRRVSPVSRRQGKIISARVESFPEPAESLLKRVDTGLVFVTQTANVSRRRPDFFLDISS